MCKECETYEKEKVSTKYEGWKITRKSVLSKSHCKRNKHKPALLNIVQTAIKPVYEALSKEKLLQKCLGGFTKNTNEY